MASPTMKYDSWMSITASFNVYFFFFSSRRRHTRYWRDWSSDVCFFRSGTYKKENNITILQTRRWNHILERAYKKGEKFGLSKEFITKYFDAVHMESINHQNKVFNS